VKLKGAEAKTCYATLNFIGANLAPYQLVQGQSAHRNLELYKTYSWFNCQESKIQVSLSKLCNLQGFSTKINDNFKIIIYLAGTT
jgi:hypothetical protein